MMYTRTEVYEDVFKGLDDGSDKYGASKDSKFRDYRRKTDMLKDKFPEFEFLKGKSNETKLSKDERDILYALLHEASKGNSLMAQWLRHGSGYMNSEQIVDMYESLQKCLYTEAQIDGWGKKPTIDTWLQSYDVMVDYSISKRIVVIKNKAEGLRKKGRAINHQIDVGSIVCNSDEGDYYANQLVYPYFERDSANPKNIDPMDYGRYTNLTQYLSGVEKLLELYDKDMDMKVDDTVLNIMVLAMCCYDLHCDEGDADEGVDENLDDMAEVEYDSSTTLSYSLFYNAVADELQNNSKLFKRAIDSVMSDKEAKRLWERTIKNDDDIIKMIREMADYV